MSLSFTHMCLHIRWTLGQESPSCFQPHCHPSPNASEKFLFYKAFLVLSLLVSPSTRDIVYYIVMPLWCRYVRVYLPLLVTCELFCELLGLALYVRHGSSKANYYYIPSKRWFNLELYSEFFSFDQEPYGKILYGILNELGKRNYF